ncbi:MAG: hypothetical protein NT120_03970 [Candidatus Aenigmarchaeota archaeon]|nr:hypothetical protein [Candidatus Aenigmarchaeota archaeon]
MNWMDFLKPTKGKIILFLVLVFVLNYFIISFVPVAQTGLVLAGIPLGFWLVGGSGLGNLKLDASVNFSPTNFVVDLIFWYFVSCVIAEMYQKIRKK